MPEGISLLGELTLRVVCETTDTIRLGTISAELVNVHYSTDNDRVKTESQFLMRHLIENPYLDSNDLLQIVCVNPFLAAHAATVWPESEQVVDTMWRLHRDQIINPSGIVNVAPFRGLMKSTAIPERVFLEVVEALSANPDNGPYLLAVVRDHLPGKMVEEKVLSIDWLPARLREKIGSETAQRQ